LGEEIALSLNRYGELGFQSVNAAVYGVPPDDRVSLELPS